MGAATDSAKQAVERRKAALSAGKGSGAVPAHGGTVGPLGAPRAVVAGQVVPLARAQYVEPDVPSDGATVQAAPCRPRACTSVRPTLGPGRDAGKPEVPW